MTDAILPHPFEIRNLPTPEEYRKRKVALISGVCQRPLLLREFLNVFCLSGITGQDGSYL